jgi:hypothetical protein
MNNSWINHVKSYAEKNGISYKESLSKSKESYVKSNATKKEKPVKKIKVLKTKKENVIDINE